MKTPRDDTSGLPKVELVKLADITLLPKFQVRSKIDPKTVNAYATAMKAGQEFQPVRLARIRGELVLIDGWHRYAARKKLAERSKDKRERRTWSSIPATIENMTERDARWEAATANLTHGLRLGGKEKWRVFNTYMTTRRYLKADGRPKSSREMAADLKGALSHVSILKKIERHYPSVYDAMRKSEDAPKLFEGGPPERHQEESLMRDDCLGHIEHARSAASLVTSTGELRAIYEAASQLVEELARELKGRPQEGPGEF